MSLSAAVLTFVVIFGASFGAVSRIPTVRVNESVSARVLSRPRDLQLRFIWWSAPQVQEFMTREASARLAASRSPRPECVLLPPLAAPSLESALPARLRNKDTITSKSFIEAQWR